MDHNTVTCSNCGATCKATDAYCKRCWKSLTPAVETEDPTQNGMSQSQWVDWELYIGKNADRYLDIYKENYGKKLFPHINWSAFCFGLNWVLYRRMFKVALIGFLVSALLSVFLMTMFLLPYREEIISLQQSTDQFAFLDIEEIVAEAQLMCFCLIPFSCAFWGFYGDAIYKMHIEKNIHSNTRNNGGTSVGELLAGRFVLSVIEAVLLNPIVYLIMWIIF